MKMKTVTYDNTATYNKTNSDLCDCWVLHRTYTKFRNLLTKSEFSNWTSQSHVILNYITLYILYIILHYFIYTIIYYIKITGCIYPHMLFFRYLHEGVLSLLMHVIEDNTLRNMFDCLRIFANKPHLFHHHEKYFALLEEVSWVSKASQIFFTEITSCSITFECNTYLVMN